MPLPQNGISFAAAPGIQQPGHLRQIDGGSFWPDTDLDQMRLSCRIDNTVTPERLFQAAGEAVAETRRQLSALTRRHSSLPHQNFYCLKILLACKLSGCLKIRKTQFSGSLKADRAHHSGCDCPTASRFCASQISSSTGRPMAAVKVKK